MNLNKANIADTDVAGKRVLMRVDFNVPQDKKTGEITNNQRIVGAIPTIKLALDKGAKAVVLMSHLGRPDGKPNASMSLKPVAVRLGELMGRPVTFLPECVGAEVEAACADPSPGSIIVLENLRWHVEEEGKSKDVTASEEQVIAFRAALAKLGDVYVNDAFGTAHRAHASMVGMAGKMPCVSGLLVAKELEAFANVLDPSKVQRPLTAIVGGAKISDKILVIENLIEQSDRIMCIGGMAYTFLKISENMPIGKSLFDKKGAALVPKLMEKAKAKGCEMVFPCDWACGQDFCNDQEVKVVTKEGGGIPDGWEGMDCGPKSMALFREKILASKTVIWNGPAGVFEFDNFGKGTEAVLEAVAETTRAGNKGIIGGGDSATAAAKYKMEDQVTFVSTGGGASLELLEGKILPGIAALDAPAPAAAPCERESQLDVVLELLAHIQKRGGGAADMGRVLLAAAASKKMKASH
jgi:phosphoglycerate kinase